MSRQFLAFTIGKYSTWDIKTPNPEHPKSAGTEKHSTHDFQNSQTFRHLKTLRHSEIPHKSQHNSQLTIVIRSKFSRKSKFGIIVTRPTFVYHLQLCPQTFCLRRASSVRLGELGGGAGLGLEVVGELILFDGVVGSYGRLLGHLGRTGAHDQRAPSLWTQQRQHLRQGWPRVCCNTS